MKHTRTSLATLFFMMRRKILITILPRFITRVITYGHNKYDLDRDAKTSLLEITS
jgi:hypothetical protein